MGGASGYDGPEIWDDDAGIRDGEAEAEGQRGCDVGTVTAEDQWTPRWVLASRVLAPERDLSHIDRALLGMTPSTPGDRHGSDFDNEDLMLVSPSISEAEN
jgi:hypothetical protein